MIKINSQVDIIDFLSKNTIVSSHIIKSCVDISRNHGTVTFFKCTQFTYSFNFIFKH